MVVVSLVRGGGCKSCSWWLYGDGCSFELKTILERCENQVETGLETARLDVMEDSSFEPVV